MTAESAYSTERSPAFDATPQRQFGWFVATKKPVFVNAQIPRAAPGCAVLIMAPIGIESQGSAATLDALSKILCDAGHIAVRFDPPGTGNSAGECPAGPVWEDWIDSTVDVIAATRQCWPERSVVIVSLQLSTAVALDAIERANLRGLHVSGLVGWAPTVNGKRFLRALKMFGAVALPAGGEQTDGVPTEDQPQSIESGGYAFGTELQESIRRINLSGADAPAVDSVLIIDRDDISSVDPWVNHLRSFTGSQTSIDVVVQKLEGTLGARFDDPEKGVVPVEICSAIADWVDAQRRTDTHRSSQSPEAVRFPLVSTVSLLEHGHEITETVHVMEVPSTAAFDAASILAISTQPADSTAAGLQSRVVITSTGANTSSGPGRLNAVLARRLGRAGHVVVRYDRRGVGGSIGTFRVPPTVSPEIAVSAEAYCPEHVHDLEVVVRHLAKGGRHELDLVGTCSGATLAYRFVLGGHSVLRVGNLVTINQILWDNEVVDLSQESSLVDAKVTGKLLAAVKSPLKWPTLIRSDLHVRRNILRVVRHVVSSAKVPRRDEGDRNPFHRLAATGVRMTQVFDVEEVGPHYLRETYGDSIDRLRRNGQLETWTIEGAGHTFNSGWSKRWLEERLAALLLGGQGNGT